MTVRQGKEGDVQADLTGAADLRVCQLAKAQVGTGGLGPLLALGTA